VHVIAACGQHCAAQSRKNQQGDPPAESIAELPNCRIAELARVREALFISAIPQFRGSAILKMRANLNVCPNAAPP
jgi:hypothetical protein